jgi:hypothetical protein
VAQVLTLLHLFAIGVSKVAPNERFPNANISVLRGRV